MGRGDTQEGGVTVFYVNDWIKPGISIPGYNRPDWLEIHKLPVSTLQNKRQASTILKPDLSPWVYDQESLRWLDGEPNIFPAMVLGCMVEGRINCEYSEEVVKKFLGGRCKYLMTVSKGGQGYRVNLAIPKLWSDLIQDQAWSEFVGHDNFSRVKHRDYPDPRGKVAFLGTLLGTVLPIYGLERPEVISIRHRRNALSQNVPMNSSSETVKYSEVSMITCLRR